MSTIDKLMILGVRSFDTRRGETIKFEPPLTLVAGANGSGKTTIIECLKFATTGILPPGSKIGGAFVHDPGLEGEREVLAQVKLGFHSTTGARMVATRSMQLGVKKNARSQKTLEAVLLVDREGQRSTISTRVAELDASMPSYLGVSTAVLENVIFCHQDESLWPLAESSTLKKKFDDIFEAAKYTRAVDELKKIRKKHREELGKFEILADSAKKDRDRARRVEKRCQELQNEVEELREKASDLLQKMNQAQSQAAQAWSDSEEFSKILGKLEGYRIEANGKQSTISNLKLHLKEVDESDEWLETKLLEFDATMGRYDDDCRQKKEAYLEYKDEIENMQEEKSQKTSLKGKYEKEKEDYERQIERRKQMVREAASKHQIRGFDDLRDESEVEEFLFKIRKLSREKVNALDRARRDADAEKREGQTQINKLTERKAALQDMKINAKRQIALNDRELGEYQKRAGQKDYDEGSKAILESRINDLDTKLTTGRNSWNAADRETKLKEAKVELDNLEDTSARLNEELVQGTKRGQEVAKLSHLKQELSEKQKSLQTLLQAYSERVKGLIGADWDPSSIEEVYESAVSDAVKDVAAAERERDSVVRELEHVQFKHNTARDDIATRKEQAKHAEQSVCKVIDADISEYDEAVKSAQFRVDYAKDQAQGVGGLADWFSRVLQTASDSHACRMCERAFKGPEDPNLVRFKKRLDGLIKKTSEKEQESDLNEALEEQKKITDSSVSYETWKRLVNDEIPGLEEELRSLNQQREKLNSRIESHDKKVEDRQTVKKELDMITKPVSSIARSDTEILLITQQVAELSSKQSQGGNLRTLEDIQQELTETSEKSRTVKKTITKLTADQDAANSELHSMELELRDLKSELGNAVAQLDKKAGFAAQNQRQREIIDKSDQDISKVEPDLSTAQAKYDEIVQRWDGKLSDLTRDSASLSDTANAFSQLNEAIATYVETDSAGRLTSTVRDIKNLQQKIEQNEAAQMQLTREISKIEEQVRDKENTKRHYSDNLAYRRESRALELLRSEITILESRNAHVDRDRLQRESEKRTQEYHNYSGRREGIVGEMKSKDVQLAELLSEYKTDLADAAHRYKEAHIRVETTKAAVEDIGRYGTALDRAIMKYHSLKMDEVNSIIDELWRNTYQGTDVDTIYIKSDLEVKASTRSHNYRVVMVKKDVELDMRGRCSAGQKVLASIIIRLALAECFSKDCGVIALDEPTTNLDQDNIKALAKSLHDIIKVREQQANFQLIVITHDEQFLKHMQCGDFTDSYYRVSRDPNDNSIMERTSIMGIL